MNRTVNPEKLATEQPHSRWFRAAAARCGGSSYTDTLQERGAIRLSIISRA